MNQQNSRHQLSKAEQRALLEMARKMITWAVKRGEKPRFDYDFKVFKEKRGAFVTITKKGQLRGCIGFVLPVKPLDETVAEMAVAAAQRDPRFPPVSENELNDIEIEISVLSPLEPVRDISDIQIGAHGLYIKKGYHSGLLLPQVAERYNWSREEFLRQVCLKAGLPPEEWREEDAIIEMFSAHVFSEAELEDKD